MDGDKGVLVRHLLPPSLFMPLMNADVVEDVRVLFLT